MGIPQGHTLFLDTSYRTFVALFDQQMNQVQAISPSSLKASQVLQRAVHEILESQSLNPTDISQLVTIAGPGSYTGLRVASGFSDIWELNGFECYSFYHYDIFEFLKKDAMWVANAFKGEYFYYRYQQGHSEKFNISKDDFEQLLEECKGNIFSPDLQGTRAENYYDFLNNHQKEILSLVIAKKIKREVFYFRPDSQEFTKK